MFVYISVYLETKIAYRSIPLQAVHQLYHLLSSRMGCGASKVPAIILPDPQPDVEWKALIKRQNMIGFDFNVFQDFDEKKKWLFIDKKGSLFKGPKYILENFVREPGKKEGQCLCAAKIPLEDVHVKIYGVETHEDSDDSDGYSDDSADEATTTVKVTTMKWAQTLKAKFYRDRSFENKFAELKVKAKGKAKKKEVTESENEQSKTSVTITKKVNNL